MLILACDTSGPAVSAAIWEERPPPGGEAAPGRPAAFDHPDAPDRGAAAELRAAGQRSGCVCLRGRTRVLYRHPNRDQFGQSHGVAAPPAGRRSAYRPWKPWPGPIPLAPAWWSARCSMPGTSAIYASAWLAGQEVIREANWRSMIS